MLGDLTPKKERWKKKKGRAICCSFSLLLPFFFARAHWVPHHTQREREREDTAEGVSVPQGRKPVKEKIVIGTRSKTSHTRAC